MTNLRTKLGAIVLPAAVLSLSALGLAAGSNAETAGQPLPMQCEISVTQGSYGYTYKALLKADTTVEGSYELKISKSAGGSTNIRQGGPFRVMAGETAMLGQATVGAASPADVEAELLLHFDGKTYLCSTQTDI